MRTTVLTMQTSFHCKKCKHRLTRGESIALGYGATCYKKHLQELEEAFLKAQITIFEVMEEDENRHTLQNP